MEVASPLWIGLNARLAPNCWRPALDEVRFAHTHGFQSIQLRGPDDGLGEAVLGAALTAVAEGIRAAGLVVALEMLILVDGEGRTASGLTPLDVLSANLPAITTLPCRYVHWHIGALEATGEAAMRRLEAGLAGQFRQGAAAAGRHGFRFGFENNEPGHPFSGAEVCRQLLEAVPGLGLVWDLNHTMPGDVAGFARLIPRTAMLHVSDTPLPEVNHHLPLGLGTLDLASHCRTLLEAGFRGPAILEIGGHAKSGGYGRDTDQALVDSRRRLEGAFRGWAIGRSRWRR